MSEPMSEKAVHRLTPEAYKELERALPEPRATDGIQAAYNLGVQAVLKKLREGFVV